MSELKIIEVERDRSIVKDDRSFTRGELILLSLPCPGTRIYRGGIGGQAITSCTICGEVMASTAGPHSTDSRHYKPVLVDNTFDGHVVWHPFTPERLALYMKEATDG